MRALQCELLPAATLWPEYYRSFGELSRTVRLLQSLTSADADALSKASAEVENARIAYNCRRDALVERILLPKRTKAAQELSS